MERAGKGGGGLRFSALSPPLSLSLGHSLINFIHSFTSSQLAPSLGLGRQSSSVWSTFVHALTSLNDERALDSPSQVLVWLDGRIAVHDR